MANSTSTQLPSSMIVRRMVRWKPCVVILGFSMVISGMGLTMFFSINQRTHGLRLAFTLAWMLSTCLSTSLWADLDCLRLNSLEWYADTCDEIHVIRVTKTGNEDELPVVALLDSIKTSSHIAPGCNVVPLPRYSGSMMKTIGSEWVVFGRRKAGKIEVLHFINLTEPMAITSAGELLKQPEAILKALRDRAVLQTTFPPRFDPNLVETFDPESIASTSFSPRLVDYYLGWAKRDVDILFDSDNLIVSVREPIGPKHRERFLKIGESWGDGWGDRIVPSSEVATDIRGKAFAATLGLVNFPDEEVRSKLQSWTRAMNPWRRDAAFQVLKYWDFIRDIEHFNIQVVGRWKLEVDVNDMDSPIVRWISRRRENIESIEFELYADQEMAMIFVSRGKGFSSNGEGIEEKSFTDVARGHWTADKDLLSVTIESTMSVGQGRFEHGHGHPETFPVLRDAKLDANNRIAIQSKIDLRKWPNDAPDLLNAMKATWLRPLTEMNSELTSLSSRRKRDPSDK